jgi:DNA primase
MRFDENFLDELKSRLRPSDVIGKSVKLRRQGREWVGLSPFNKEKSPSFYVNDQKGFFHDFSSGKHGDIISFLQETERLSFNEAVERLARDAGMALPVQSPAQQAVEAKSRSLQDFMDLAAKWYAARLHDKTREAQIARDYLKRRGLSDEDIATFGLGYAPKERTGLKDALMQRGATPQELVECGLLIQPEGSGSSFDRFRERLMFPIHDARERIVSFGGRALNPDEKAKYLNGPETVLFHKGQMLFGLPGALRILGAESQKSALVVVEGYMDVLACQRAKIAAVAPMGTALTEEQIDLLWRRHPEPTLCFDGDDAGKRAAYRALDRALPKLKPGRSFKVCFLPQGQDPDDMLREKGALALREAIAQTSNFVEVLFKRESEAEPLDTPEHKAGLKKRLRALAALIEDKDLAEAYRQDLLGRYDGLFAKPAQGVASYSYGQQPFVPHKKGTKFTRFNEPPPTTEESKRAAKALSRALDPLSAALAQGLLDNPEWLDDHTEALNDYGLGDEALAPLVKAIITLSFTKTGLDKASLSRHLDAIGLGALRSEISKAALKSRVPFLAPDIALADAHAQWLKSFDAVARLTALDRALNSAKEQVFTDFYSRLKLERDGLRRALKTGDIWLDDKDEVQ